MEFLKLHLPAHMPLGINESFETIYPDEEGETSLPTDDDSDDYNEERDAQFFDAQDRDDFTQLLVILLAGLAMFKSDKHWAFKNESDLDIILYAANKVMDRIAAKTFTASPSTQQQRYLIVAKRLAEMLQRLVKSRRKWLGWLLHAEIEEQRDEWERYLMTRIETYMPWRDVSVCRRNKDQAAMQAARENNTLVAVSNQTMTAGAVVLIEHWKLDNVEAVADVQEATGDEAVTDAHIASDAEIYCATTIDSQDTHVIAYMTTPWQGSLPEWVFSNPGFPAMIQEKLPGLAMILSWLADDDLYLQRHQGIGIRYIQRETSMTPTAFDKQATQAQWSIARI